LTSPAEEFLKRTAAAELTPGETLAQYRVEIKLGEGGMGAVYQAYDTRLHREVALKVLPPEHLADPERRQRLMREARAASALNHPNIVTVYEIGSEHGVDFIAMEFVEGKTLHEIIRAKGLPLGKALNYGRADCRRPHKLPFRNVERFAPLRNVRMRNSLVPDGKALNKGEVFGDYSDREHLYG
jgi:serine/threonine protein kinase